MSARYRRAPSDRLLRLFAPDQLLSGLREPLEMRVGDRTVSIDVQFRERDEVMLYCGQTRVLCLRPKGEDFVAYAHDTYSEQDCAVGMLRLWTSADTPRAFATALQYYLANLRVGERWIRKEGGVQVRRLGNDTASIGEPPWVPIDREVVLGHGTEAKGGPPLQVGTMDAALEALRCLAGEENWKAPDALRAANEVDQLALSRDGERLILVELKHKADGSASAYAPLQVMRYATEWAAALEGPNADAIVNGVNALARAKHCAGLLDEPPTLVEHPAVQPIVAFNEPPTNKVQRRLAKVVQALQDNIPGASVEKLEIWCWPDGRPPERLDVSWGQRGAST